MSLLIEYKKASCPGVFDTVRLCLLTLLDMQDCETRLPSRLSHRRYVWLWETSVTPALPAIELATNIPMPVSDNGTEDSEEKTPLAIKDPAGEVRLGGKRKCE